MHQSYQVIKRDFLILFWLLYKLLLARLKTILFESKIRALDIDEDICGFHHLRERHGRPVMMFEDVEIPGVEQFLRPRLPAGVPELSWPVVLSEEGMSGSELNAVLQGYLRCSEEVSEDE